jgi:hypothetical protein
VASEMLPGSTERAVTISGKYDSIIECFKQVALIMYESPPKGDTLTFKPRQSILQQNTNHVSTNASTIGASMLNTNTTGHILFANGQAYQVQGQYAIPLPPHEVNFLYYLFSEIFFLLISSTKYLMNHKKKKQTHFKLLLLL